MTLMSRIICLVFAIVLFSSTSWAACQFEWTLGSYCGTGNVRVPEQFFGPFTNACRTHDFCYFAAGEQIAKETDEGYLRTTADINRRKSESKRQCDTRFYQDLSQACSQVSDGGACQAIAQIYSGAVIVAGDAAFTRSIDNACR